MSKDNGPFKGRLSISGPSSGDVRIEVRCESSHQRFLEIKISHEELMQAIMGLAERPMEFETGDLSRVGKKIVSEDITVEVGKADDIEYKQRHPRAIVAIAKFCKERSKKDGVHWVGSTYLGSKSSFHEKDGILYANTDMCRWE